MRWLWFATLTLIIFLTGLFSGWFWLWAAILILIDIFFIGIINWSFIKLHLHRAIPLRVQILLWLLITTLLLRLFVLESLTLSNTGMQPYLKNGDNVLVSKLRYGPRLPITPINFPFTHHYLPFSRGKQSYLVKPAIPYIRLRGFVKIQRGDLMAYNFPEGDSVYIGAENLSYHAIARSKEASINQVVSGDAHFRPVDRREVEVSRCLGIPGDTILFYNGQAYINGALERPNFNRYKYLVEADNTELLTELFEEFDLEASDIKILPDKGYLVPLSAEQAQKVKIQQGITNVEPYIQKQSRGNIQIFPHEPSFPWNTDQFGPVIVPSSGNLIDLNVQNISLYERLISVYEGNSLLIENNTIYINNKASSQYKVKMDYYFVAGDSRHYSRDSRHWGFLPEDHIIGKPWLIWLSLSSRPGKGIRINWDRNFDILK